MSPTFKGRELIPDTQLQTVINLTKRITMACLGIEFRLRVERDNEDPADGRIFIQCVYNAPCIIDGTIKEWHGNKQYLSRHMLPDEIIKRSYVAFEATMKHEIMEGFKVDDKILFNPHHDFEALLSLNDEIVTREPQLV